jgi:hypothetical protein
VYEASLIYASENLAAAFTKGRATKELHWHFREGIYIKITLLRRQLLETVITAGNYSLVADYNSILKRRVKMELNPF